MRRLLVLATSAVVVLAPATPAAARWTAGGTGAGAAAVATMPGGSPPTTTAAGRDVTVSWPQVVFQSVLLGARAGGGYRVTRYSGDSPAAITVGAGCAGVIDGPAATLQCVEAGVPYGTWRYTVTPVMHTFTGSESAFAATLAVTPDAPVLTSVTAQNPAPGAAVGALQVAWAPSPARPPTTSTGAPGRAATPWGARSTAPRPSPRRATPTPPQGSPAARPTGTRSAPSPARPSSSHR